MFKPELISLYFNKTITRKQVIIGFIIYMIIFLPCMAFVLSLERPNSLSPQNRLPNFTLRSPTVIPTRTEKIIRSVGLGISRSELIKAIQQQNPKVSFFPGPDVNGQKIFVSNKNLSVITLIGSEDNLHQVISKGSLDNQKIQTMLYVLGLTAIMDPDTNQWITGVIQKANTAVASSEAALTESIIFNQRKYLFTIQNNTATLTITPAETSSL